MSPFIEEKESNNSGISKEHSTLICSLCGAPWGFTHQHLLPEQQEHGVQMQEMARDVQTAGVTGL